MSEEINNRKYRAEVIKSLIAQLHEGKTVDEVKSQFEKAFDGVSADEISKAEQALIEDGMPIAEVQRLCDVHASVFKGSIADIHRPSELSEVPGHPINTLKRENRAIERLIQNIRNQVESASEDGGNEAVSGSLRKLLQIDKHYLKKENLYFPFMEQYGITAPPKVMWGVDDEIRAQLKAVVAQLESKKLSDMTQEIDAVLEKITEMIFKEENIMLPMLLEHLKTEDWKRIADDTDELGYCLISNVPTWAPSAEVDAAKSESIDLPAPSTSDLVHLATGVFKIAELERVLDTLPVDITFVDKDDTVKFFSQSKERIFPRTKSIIGRKVSNCHPPASVHIVEGIVSDFKAGKKDQEDFWIKMGEKFVYIRYFAVRSAQGEYLGTLEVTQNIKPIQDITGEKRLVSDS